MENNETSSTPLSTVEQLNELLKDDSYLMESSLKMLKRLEDAAKVNAPLKVFDWRRAETLIKESGVKHAGALLEGDEGFTSDIIWQDGKPHLESWFYPCSIWATPMLVINGEKIPCWVHMPNDPDLISEVDLPDPSLVWPDYQTKRLE